MIDLNQIGKGGLIKKISLKDYRLEVIPGAVILPTVFSLRDKIGEIKNQGRSLSCGSQATAYYTQLLNFIETKQEVELSARDIYSLVFQPQGGQYVADCASKVCNSGVVPESEAISHLQDGNVTEAFMRNRSDITTQAVEEGMTYWAKKYVTWDNSNLDLYKQAIIQGQGCMVVSWGNNVLWANAQIGLPDLPSQMTWRHIIYLIGYDDNKKCFEFVNSWSDQWGEKGFGWLPYDYATKGYLTNPITIIDLPNGQYSLMMKLIGLYKNLIAILTKK